MLHPATCDCFLAFYKTKDDEENELGMLILENFIERELARRLQWRAYYEGFCSGCWTKLFEPRFVQITDNLYQLDANSQPVEITRNVYEKHAANPQCPWCDVALDQNKTEILDDDDDDSDDEDDDNSTENSSDI
jgi:hypothetical protein